MKKSPFIIGVLLCFGYISLLIFSQINTPGRDTIQNPTIQPIVIMNTTTCIQNPNIRFFMYHYVRDDDPRDPPTTRSLSVTPANFESHLKKVSELQKNGKIAILNGADFLKAYYSQCFPNKNIWIFTSDDGWIDMATNLVPLAKKYNIPFILGIISGKIGHTGFVNENDVKDFAQNSLFTIASHTISHRNLSSLSQSEEKEEICTSKKSLEKLINKKLHYFIYPSGRIGAYSQKYLKECGYDIAWSTSFGKNFDWNNLRPFVINRTRISHNLGPKVFENFLD